MAAELKVIGAGCGRTGTSSLREALKILGHNPYHMEECVRNDHFGLWLRAGRGELVHPRGGGAAGGARGRSGGGVCADECRRTGLGVAGRGDGTGDGGGVDDARGERRTCTVARRYSMFLELHASIAPQLALPHKLPAKKKLLNTEKVKKQRVDRLQDYLCRAVAAADPEKELRELAAQLSSAVDEAIGEAPPVTTPVMPVAASPIIAALNNGL